MSFLAWMTLASTVLLLVALASSFLRDLPISTAAVYLLLGIVLGPLGAGVVRLDVIDVALFVERITEVAVIVALYVGGLKLRLRWHDPAWRAAVILAGPVMVLSIGGLAAFAHFVLGLPVALSLLLAAILAPTDPVLASAVAVNDSDDHDRMRYGISGEAGLNDGTAFPFVMFGLAWAAEGGAGGWIAEWFLLRILWAIPAALVLGYLLGLLVGRVAIKLRTRQRDATAPSDLLALALIGTSYVAADAIHAWGYLAVFAAGLGLRAAEVKVVHETPHPDVDTKAIGAADDARCAHPPAEALVAARVGSEQLDEPAIAAGVLVSETLSFGDTVERLVEVGLIVVIGIALAEHWDVRAIPLALALFFVIRPVAARLGLTFSPTTRPQRWLMGWFGVRGIGSLYYLAYSMRHGLTGDAAYEVAGLVISVIAMSIVLHGVTATPLLTRYERSLADHPQPAGAH